MTPTPALINVFIDSDGPIADFDFGLRQSGLTADKFKHLPGVYLWLPVTAGAEVCINTLWALDKANDIRVWIATKTPTNSPYAYTEKVLWYQKHFPFLVDRVILTHDKSVLGGEKDFLLDDRPHKANADLFKGTFSFFDVANPISSWAKFVDKVQLAAVRPKN